MANRTPKYRQVDHLLESARAALTDAEATKARLEEALSLAASVQQAVANIEAYGITASNAQTNATAAAKAAEEQRVQLENTALSAEKSQTAAIKKLQAINETYQTTLASQLTVVEEALEAKAASHLAQIETKITPHVEEIGKLRKSAGESFRSIDNYRKRLLEGNSKAQSYKAAFDEMRQEVADLRSMLHGDKEGLYRGKPSFDLEIVGARSTIGKVKTELETRLAELTDAAIIDAFDGQSAAARSQRKWLTFWTTSLLITAASISIYVSNDINIESMTWSVWLFKASSVVPILVAVLFLNRETKVSRATEEIYRYKAALTKALRGYRNLYDLDHKSDEYMELFNVLKLELLRNPMAEVGKHLDQDLPWDRELEFGSLRFGRPVKSKAVPAEDTEITVSEDSKVTRSTRTRSSSEETPQGNATA